MLPLVKWLNSLTSYQILDLDEPPTTKPPKHRENLPWPSRPQYGANVGVKNNQRQSYSSPERGGVVGPPTSQRVEHQVQPLSQRVEQSPFREQAQENRHPTAPKLPSATYEVFIFAK